MTSPRPVLPAKPQRRRPSQSRARLTAQALQQAFVQLLVESDYPRISIRAITGLAGTSLGSFYEYFASKEDLARVCLHLRSKELLTALQQAVEARRGRPLAELVQAVLASQLAAHRAQPAEWSAHYLLERHLSGVEAYRKMYQRFIEGWVQVIEAAGIDKERWPARQRPAGNGRRSCVAWLVSCGCVRMAWGGLSGSTCRRSRRA